MTEHITSVAIRQERDVVLARRQARLIGEMLGFNRQDQTRIATATSELARNAYEYAGGGDVTYDLERDGNRTALVISIGDRGPGIDDLQSVLDGTYRSATGMGIGIAGVKRLMDQFEIDTHADRGTKVVMGKNLRNGAQRGTLDAAAIGVALARGAGEDPFAEMQRQNQELISAIEEVEQRERELTALHAQLEERAQASRVLSEVADGIVLVGADGTVNQWNRAAALIVGRTAEEVLGKPAVAAIPGWETFVARIPITNSPSGETASGIVPIEIDDREVWLSGAGVALPEGTVYAFRNVTRERTLEHMRNELIATVSHELRTPLASVCGAALTLQRTDIELSEEVRGSLLGVIVTESARLERIAAGILVSSQLKAGELPIAIHGADTVQIANDAVAAARAGLTTPRNILLSVVDEMPTVECDPERMAQVLVNLVDNAVKYSPEGGTIDVELTYADGVARYEVRDEGVGIPAEEHERIFERFYRLDPDLHSSVSGTGLGLYISRELVRLMGGKIEVRSELGQGASFVVELPLAAG